MKPINYLIILITGIVFLSCSGSKDLSTLSPEERFALAKEKFDKKDYLEAINDLESIMIQFSGSWNC